MKVRRFMAGTAVAIVLAVASVLLSRAYLSEQVEAVPLAAWSIFFGLNGFFFAVLIGLLIAELLRRFHRLNEVVRLEAGALGRVKRALRLQEDSRRMAETIREDVGRYAMSVLEVEWPQMAVRNRVHGEGGSMGELYDLLFQIRALEIDGKMDDIARRLLIDSAVDVARLRAERLHLSAEHLSPVIRGVILFLSVVIVGSFTLLTVGSLGIHIFMVVLLGLAVSFLNLGLADLASPLVGLWNVSPEPFEEVAEKATREEPVPAGISGTSPANR